MPYNPPQPPPVEGPEKLQGGGGGGAQNQGFGMSYQYISYELSLKSIASPSWLYSTNTFLKDEHRIKSFFSFKSFTANYSVVASSLTSLASQTL